MNEFKWLTVRQVAERAGMSPQSVRKMFPVQHFGKSVRIWEGHLPQVAGKKALDAIYGDPGLTRVLKDYSSAMAAIEFMDADPCPVMAGLLMSTIAACRIENPTWPVIGVEAVFPPVLAFFRDHLPQGGGTKGDELRALILAA